MVVILQPRQKRVIVRSLSALRGERQGWLWKGLQQKNCCTTFCSSLSKEGGSKEYSEDDNTAPTKYVTRNADEEWRADSIEWTTKISSKIDIANGRKKNYEVIVGSTEIKLGALRASSGISIGTTKQLLHHFHTILRLCVRDEFVHRSSGRQRLNIILVAALSVAVLHSSMFRSLLPEYPPNCNKDEERPKRKRLMR